MDGQDVARVLEEIASHLELCGGPAQQVRAYHAAGRSLRSTTGDLRQLNLSDIVDRDEFGSEPVAVVEEMLETGQSRRLDELRRRTPPGLIEMIQLPGLGVSKVRQIYHELGIDMLSELEEAARSSRLSGLPRFGEKTTENILKAIALTKRPSEYRLYHNALSEADAIKEVLEDLPQVRSVEIAGSLRRRREVTRDLDFVLLLEGSLDALAERLASASGVREFVDQASESVTLRFQSGMVAELFTAARDQFGFQLLRATGNQAHLDQLRTRAASLGLAWTDRGLYRDNERQPSASEEDVYQSLGMDFVTPELREGLGEVEAAVRHELPRLIERAQLRGFLHCHSNYSDGTSTVADWARAGREAGYEYVGITDHSGAATAAGGLSDQEIARQREEIVTANAEYPNVRVLQGIEVDILVDGSLDYSPETRSQFDFVIASVHHRAGMDRRQMTDRILKAMEDPDMAILGHPTGRLLLSRDPYPMDLDALFDRAAAQGVAVEINADPQRLDLDWRQVRRAVEKGVTISLGADAHSTSGMGNMDIGIGIARKGWLTEEEVLNTRSCDVFLEFTNRRRRSR